MIKFRRKCFFTPLKLCVNGLGNGDQAMHQVLYFSRGEGNNLYVHSFLIIAEILSLILFQSTIYVNVWAEFSGQYYSDCSSHASQINTIAEDKYPSQN